MEDLWGIYSKHNSSLTPVGQVREGEHDLAKMDLMVPTGPRYVPGVPDGGVTR